MIPLLLLSIALVIGSLIGTIVLWVQSAETRVGLFGGLFLVFAAHQGVELWSHWGTPLAIDASAATAIAGVIEGMFSVAIVVALSRTLGERDQVEAIHWDSMEAVRVMNELSMDDKMAFETKVAKLLEAGKKRYAMEVGMFSRVSRERYEVLAVDSSEDFPISRGCVLSIDETFCRSTIEANRPIGMEQITKSGWNSRLARSAFAYESYLGAAVRVGGLPYGTLSFGSSKLREDRFNATEKDLVQLMARWLGTEIEKRDGVHAYVEGATAHPASQTRTSEKAPQAVADRFVEQTPRNLHPPIRSVGKRMELDANKVLRRLDRQLRTLLGEKITLNLKLDTRLELAFVSRLPIDAIIRTLVLNAKDAMADGGELVIETANLELVTGEPGVIPAVAPDRYVIIAVRDTGAEQDADALSRIYDPSPDASEPGDVSNPRGRLTLSTIYRLLQICGGDLSVDVEPGLGSTFTVYLPRTRDVSSADRPQLRTPHLSRSFTE